MAVGDAQPHVHVTGLARDALDDLGHAEGTVGRGQRALTGGGNGIGEVERAQAASKDCTHSA